MRREIANNALLHTLCHWKDTCICVDFANENNVDYAKSASALICENQFSTYVQLSRILACSTILANGL